MAQHALGWRLSTSELGRKVAGPRITKTRGISSRLRTTVVYDDTCLVRGTSTHNIERRIPEDLKMAMKGLEATGKIQSVIQGEMIPV